MGSINQAIPVLNVKPVAKIFWSDRAFFVSKLIIAAFGNTVVRDVIKWMEAWVLLPVSAIAVVYTRT